MRSDIVPGAIFPDYELSDHTAKRRKLSELQERRLVTVSTDNITETNEYRSGVGAHWPFLSDAGRIVHT